MLVILESSDVSENTIKPESKTESLLQRRTRKMISRGSSRFTLRMRRASSGVILCSRVSLSVTEPDVAVLRPAASPAAPPTGRC